MASSPNYADGPERFPMIQEMKTKHDGVYLYLEVSNGGVSLTLSREITVDWLPRGFPLDFNKAIDAVLGGEPEKNFSATSFGGIEVCGIIERLPDSNDGEHFYKLLLQKGPAEKNSLPIKLRETELKQIQATFIGFWTC